MESWHQTMSIHFWKWSDALSDHFLKLYLFQILKVHCPERLWQGLSVSRLRWVKWITTTEVVHISKHAGLPLARCMAITPLTLSRNSHWGHSWWAITALFKYSLCASRRQHGIVTASLWRGGDLQLPPQKMHVEVSLSPRYLEIVKLGSKILHEYCVLHSRHVNNAQISVKQGSHSLWWLPKVT